MKGQIAFILLVLFLLLGIVILGVITIVFIPLLQSILVTPILEPPIVGAITALFGFLPDQCSTLSTLDCRFCLATQKVVPFVVNIVFGIILFSVLLGRTTGPLVRWGRWTEHEERYKGLIKGAEYWSVVLLISTAFSIFMLHQTDPLMFVNAFSFFLAVVVRIIGFMVMTDNEGRNRIAALTHLTDFFIAAYILVFGWTNWWIIPIIIIVGFTFTSTIVGPPGGERPRRRFTPMNIGIMLVVFSLIGVYLFWVLEGQIPLFPFGVNIPKIEFPGIGTQLTERFGLPEIKCGKNIIGPESSISF